MQEKHCIVYNPLYNLLYVFVACDLNMRVITSWEYTIYEKKVFIGNW